MGGNCAPVKAVEQLRYLTQNALNKHHNAAVALNVVDRMLDDMEAALTPPSNKEKP